MSKFLLFAAVLAGANTVFTFWNPDTFSNNPSLIRIGDTIEIQAPPSNPGYQLLTVPSDSKIIIQVPEYKMMPVFGEQDRNASFDGWTIISDPQTDVNQIWKFRANKPGKYVFILAHKIRDDIYSPYYWDYKRIFLEVK